MSNARVQLRRDVINDWANASPPAALAEGEIGFFHNNTSGNFEYLKIGKMVIGSPSTQTIVDDLPEWYLLSVDERDKLASLQNPTGEYIVNAINAQLNVDLAAALGGQGLTGPAIAGLLDSHFGNTVWRSQFALAFNGRPFDEDGNLLPAANDYAVADITGLVSALAGKSDTGHGHTTSQITGLDAALSARVLGTSIGVANGVAGLDENAKVPLAQLPAGVGNDVTSVFGRQGVVVAANGDYNAGQVTFTPSGFVAATTVQTAIAEMIAEVIPLTQKGAASGVCPLNSSSKIDSSYLQTADSSAVLTIPVSWAQGSVTFTNAPAAVQEWTNVTRRATLDLTRVPAIYITTTLSVNGSTGTKMHVQYWDGSAWAETGCEKLIDGTSGTGYIVSSSAALPSGAKTSATIIRVVISGGNAATSPQLQGFNVNLVTDIPINTGTPSGAQMVAAIDTNLGSTAWRDPAGALANASVTMAKIENFNQNTAPLRVTAGAGALEKATQAQWQTFLDSVVSFNGRKGVITPGGADYTTALVADTTDKRYVTDLQRSLVDRMSTTTRFTSSSVVGLNEAFAIFNGTGLTATITNGSRCNFVAISNNGGGALTVVSQNANSLRNALGNVVASLSIPAPTVAGEPQTMCFWRDPSDGTFRLR